MSWNIFTFTTGQTDKANSQVEQEGWRSNFILCFYTLQRLRLLHRVLLLFINLHNPTSSSCQSAPTFIVCWLLTFNLCLLAAAVNVYAEASIKAPLFYYVIYFNMRITFTISHIIFHSCFCIYINDSLLLHTYIFVYMFLFFRCGY